MADDWRIRIDVDDRVDTLLERLGLDLSDEARELARELEDERLAVSRDDDTVFVYTDSALQAQRAKEVVEAELRELGLTATTVLEHWLAEEERWEAAKPPVRGSGPAEGAPAGEATWEEETLARGFAPWEVRVECESHQQAEELADRLESEGYGVVRRWSYVIAGTATEEEARALAERVHGEVEAGGELVYEVPRGNPFAVFAFHNLF